MKRKPSVAARLVYPIYCLMGIKYLRRLFKFYRQTLRFGSCLVFEFSNSIGDNSKFEGCNKIYPRSSFSGSMGYGSYIGPDCHILANIGRFTSIAPFVRINEGAHPYSEPYVTTSPMFFSTREQTGETFANRMMYDESRAFSKIGSDCWICENVFISGDVNIGDGAVVLAGAVVSSDIPPYAIAGGVPAKVIGYRYDEKTIQFLIKERWWDRDISWLKTNWELFSDIDTFKRVCHEEDRA